MARKLDEPVTRVGICCGCRAFAVLLFKIPGIFRYRCSECYLREQGVRHWLDPSPGLPTKGCC
jgi:hypothetical protein